MKRIILFIIIVLFIFSFGILLNSKFENITEDITEKTLVDEVETIQSSTILKDQWGIFNTGENGAYRIDINLTSESVEAMEDNAVLIGILDTGIDINHIALKDKIYVNEMEIPNNRIDDDGNGYIDDINGWDFINKDNTVFDYWELDRHGTQSAGIIKTITENRDIKIMPLKVMEGSNEAQTDTIIEAINYAENMGIKVINCSWVAFKYDEKLEAVMKNSDILFICAAGNSSCNVTHVPSYPACYKLPNLISVASINSFGELSEFSNYGLPIHISAPGESVITTIPGDKYETVNGTSISAPFVTGVASILQNSFSQISSMEIASRIKENAFRIDTLSEIVSTGGIVDANTAISNDDKSMECPKISDIEFNEGCIELFWNSINNADYYEVEINRKVILKVDGTTYKYKNPNSEGCVIFRVRTINNKGKSKWSVASSIKVY